MKKDILLIIDITFCFLVIFCFDNPIRDFIGRTLNFPFMSYITARTLEKDGLDGCDTVPLPGDKEQIAAAFMANVDTIWRTLYKADKDSTINNKTEYVNDPAYYSEFCYLLNYKRFSKSLLPKSPKEYFKAFTDLIVYSKDKLLCMAFVVIRQDVYDGRDKLPPYFCGNIVIGKRKNKEDKFKIFRRFDFSFMYSSSIKDAASGFEDLLLYSKGETYITMDVYPVKNERKLPVLSDPDFFEKHPLFEKFDDSTYNFEWYKRESRPGEFFKYDYPY